MAVSKTEEVERSKYASAALTIRGLKTNLTQTNVKKMLIDQGDTGDAIQVNQQAVIALQQMSHMVTGQILEHAVRHLAIYSKSGDLKGNLSTVKIEHIQSAITDFLNSRAHMEICNRH